MYHLLATPPPSWMFGTLPPAALLIAIVFPAVACWVARALR